MVFCLVGVPWALFCDGGVIMLEGTFWLEE